jgi:3-oxoacyl-[acyl-carrier protein] reductase
VAQDADCRRLVETTVRDLGRLDVLVQSAGVTSFIPHPDLDKVGDDDWNRILSVNLKGPFQCARAARAPMLAAGEGTIVNVSSIAGIAGVGSSIPYCASKAALNNLTLTLARALAPKIRVNAVAPGFITGRWLEGGLGGAYEPVKKAMSSRAPLQKVCEPEDVAAAILGFVTGSDLVTGQVLVVDGGLLIAG